jgi:hypothetical protein
MTGTFNSENQMLGSTNASKSRRGSVWLVVGGGLFGCYASTLLARSGAKVVLAEQSDTIMTRASFINQARLHTGLHYPRSFATAKEAIKWYERFRVRFPDAVRDFTHIYAVAAYGSKTTAADFRRFIERLEIQVDEVNPSRWFREETVTSAFRVEEPTFDANVLREYLKFELATAGDIQLRMKTSVIGGKVGTRDVCVRFSDETTSRFDGVVISTYAGVNALRKVFDLPPLPISFELAEVLIGESSPSLAGHGLTVMDGPFWSIMPFGHSRLASLTNVVFTPLDRNCFEPEFSCQTRRTGCGPLHLANCTDCSVRPLSSGRHQLQQMKMFLREVNPFSIQKSLLTVKATLRTTEADDARPTTICKEPGANIWTVLSGKVSSIFDLETAFS